jgi:hypothetical protein
MCSKKGLGDALFNVISGAVTGSAVGNAMMRVKPTANVKSQGSRKNTKAEKIPSLVLYDDNGMSMMQRRIAISQITQLSRAGTPSAQFTNKLAG